MSDMRLIKNKCRLVSQIQQFCEEDCIRLTDGVTEWHNSDLHTLQAEDRALWFDVQSTPAGIEPTQLIMLMMANQMIDYR